eukprot:293619-Rhodomonas_salina.3
MSGTATQHMGGTTMVDVRCCDLADLHDVLGRLDGANAQALQGVGVDRHAQLPALRGAQVLRVRLGGVRVVKEGRWRQKRERAVRGREKREEERERRERGERRETQERQQASEAEMERERVREEGG